MDHATISRFVRQMARSAFYLRRAMRRSYAFLTVSSLDQVQWVFAFRPRPMMRAKTKSRWLKCQSSARLSCVRDMMVPCHFAAEPRIPCSLSSRSSFMKKLFFLGCLCLVTLKLGAAEKFADRFVWIFGWGLQNDSDVTEISRILETAGKHK